MAKFSVKRIVESDLADIRSDSRKVDKLSDEIRHIAAQIAEHGNVYAGLSEKLKVLSKKASEEGMTLDKYAEAGLTAIRLYFDTERKLCNANPYDTVRFCASDKRSKKEIDSQVDFLKSILLLFLNLLHVGKKKKELYLWYLDEYRNRLYEENGIDYRVPMPAWIYEAKQKKKREEEEKKRKEEEEIRRKEEEERKKREEEARKKKEEEEKKRKEEEARKKKEEEEKKRKAEEERKKKEEEERKRLENYRKPNYSNKLFDNQGMYGARQRLPKNDEIYEVIRMFHPDWSDAKCKKLIDRLGPEGCGYTVCANAIFQAFEGRAEEFENTYGISMYKNGDLNYDELVMYIYTSYDDASMDGLTVGDQDGIIADMMAMAGRTSSNEFNFRYEMQDELQYVKENLNKGLLTFGTQGSFDITPVGGGKTLHFDEPHIMTVTGVASDGRLIVSTWGGKYYIDPSEHANSYYSLFEFDS